MATQIDTEHDDDPNADLRAILDNALASGGEDEPDDGGLDAPLPEDTGRDKLISSKKAAEIADELSIQRSRPDRVAPEKDSAPPAEDKPAEEAAKADQPPADAEAKPEDKPADITALDAAALLEGVDPTKAGEITRRLTEVQPLRDLYDRHREELAAHGSTPAEAMGRLVDINRYAMANGAEYLAWFAGNVLPADQREAALTKAVAPFGYKLVKEDVAAVDEALLADDEFDDDSTKRLKATAREMAQKLKDAAQNQPAVQIPGPDSPAVRAERDLRAWVDEKDATGQPLRPLFETLSPVISAKAAEQLRATGKPVTTADLTRIYNDEVTLLRQRIGVPVTSAAPAQQAAVDPAKKAADAAEAARKASKSVDGSGQGASRRPAAAGPNDDIRAIVQAAFGASD